MTRLTMICTSFVIVSFMFAGQSYANVTPKTVWKSDGVAVSAISNITQVNPRIVADGYGGAIICWQDYRYTDLDIYAQRLDEDGKVHTGWTNTTYSPWEDYGVQVTGVEDGDQKNPNLVSDGSGGAIIVWLDTAKGVRGQRVDANGKLLWAGGSTSGVDIGVGGDFDIISDGAGGIFVVGQVVYSYHHDICLQRLDANGKRPAGWPTYGVDVCTAWEDQSNPTLARDRSNGVIVAWEDERKGAKGIYAQRVDGKGKIVWSSSPNGIAISTGDHQVPQIISDGAGGATITWENYPWLSWGDVHARRVGDKGNFPTGWSKTANGVPICTALSVERNPMLIRNGSGHVIITWVDYRGPDTDLYAQRVDGKGDPCSGWKKTPGTEGQKVCGASGNQDYPQLIRCCSGGAIIIWEDKRNGHGDIYAGRIQGDGSIHPKWPANGVPICSAKKDQTLEPGGQALRGAMIATDGCGGAIICWTDKRTDNWGDIFAQRLSYVKSSDLWITPHNGYWKTPDISVNPNLVTQGKQVTLVAKVHNAGPYNATGVTVKFRVAYLQAGKPFANVGTKPVDVPAGGVAKASIPWTPTESGHTCVEVEISHPDDPDLSDNRTQMNLGVRKVTSAGASPSPDFKLGNPLDPSEYPEAGEFELELDTSDLPEGWTVELDPSGPFSLPHGETLRGRLQVHVPSGAMPGEAGIVRILDRALGYWLIVGGMTFQVVVEDDIYEDNDTRETAWYPGYSWEGQWLRDFDDPGIQFDEDWYQIEVSPGCERVLVDCRFTHAEGDIDLAIMDPLGKWIASSTSVTDNEYIDVPDLAEGTYYILVHYGNGGNTYDLWWDDVERPTLFHAPEWLGNSCVEGSDAPRQTVDIWGKEVPLRFSISDDAEWLICSPTSGTLTREPVTVVVDYATSGLEAGSYSATITISAPGATNTPQTVGVDLTVGGRP